ncbi:MAG: glutamyl-tRNA reductase [Myxococcota bacterium]|jgi:glutamyl-tRNA reductase|nr:glutamyl-tRNA reductase [Myxococcota bacterium]
MRTYVVVGVSHRTAPIEMREQLAICAAELGDCAQQLCDGERILEALCLSTCNRVEAYVLADHVELATQRVIELWAKRSKLSGAVLALHCYQHFGLDAVHHVFRVVSSLDSMMLGEPQILGQVKAAYRAAAEQGALGSYLESLMQQAFKVAKRVRADTAIGTCSLSMAHLAVELSRQSFGVLSDRHALLLGAGKMSALAARELRQHGAQLTVLNRSGARAQALAEELDGASAALDALPALLPKADVLIVSAAAPQYLLTRLMLEQATQQRSAPLLVIDLSVPRMVEPGAALLPLVQLFDVDGLQRALEENRAHREASATQAEVLVDDESRSFAKRLRYRDAAPLIASLRRHFDSLAQSELATFLRAHPELDERQRAAIEGLLRSLLNKLLHAPSLAIKDAVACDDSSALQALLEQLFELPSVELQRAKPTLNLLESARELGESGQAPNRQEHWEDGNSANTNPGPSLASMTDAAADAEQRPRGKVHS